MTYELTRGGGGYGDRFFSGTLILRNEFVVIGAPNVAHVATGGKKWLKKPKSERNEMELRVTARLILRQLVVILATFFEI